LPLIKINIINVINIVSKFTKASVVAGVKIGISFSELSEKSPLATTV
jgi:hypothetical protein